MKHTRGPGEATDTGCGYGEIISPETFHSGIDGKSHRKTVARVYLCKPDARLIAAAPDMLAELMAIRESWAYGYSTYHRAEIEAAIAKATGVK